MPRIDLQVPFAEKDEAKRLGARWDASSKVWYVPDGKNPGAFKRWLPDFPDISIRSTSYFIAQTEEDCWKCGKWTRVFAFMLPAGHEELEFNDEEEIDEWYQYGFPTIVHYITDLLPAVATKMKAFSRHYHLDFSKTTQSSYWMNHCEHCGMKQGDFEMFCEPQGAFVPIDKHAASRIILHALAEPFGCNGSLSYGDHVDYVFGCMRRA